MAYVKIKKIKRTRILLTERYKHPLIGQGRNGPHGMVGGFTSIYLIG
jgi:hypothetical protein